MSSTLKKALAVAGVILVIVIYVVYTRMTATAPAAELNPIDSMAPTTTNTTSAGSETTNPNVPAGSGDDSTDPAASTQSGFADGSYTGAVADAYYGPIQVKTVIAGGKITDVQFLQYPNSAGHTTEVSQATLPKLKAEAIAAQSAQVDNISGATQTVDGFKQTMADALKQAQA